MKIINSKIRILIIVCSLFVFSSFASESIDDILKKYDHTLRKSYFSLVQKNVMKTSKYTVKNGRMVFIGQPRAVVVESVRKLVSEETQDFYSLVRVLEPVYDKGVGLLYYEYYDTKKENDNWMYLPSVDKVRRMVSTTNDNDDSGNFLGTEFCTEDMQIRKIDDYTSKLIGEDTYDGNPVWIVEMIPTEKRSKISKYGKVIAWIDKEKYHSIKEELYDHKGNLYKQHIYKDFELVDNIWTPRNSIMINLKNNRVTTNEVQYVGHNFPMENEFFSHRTFSDFAYYERNMKEYRKNWKKSNL